MALQKAPDTVVRRLGKKMKKRLLNGAASIYGRQYWSIVSRMISTYRRTRFMFCPTV